MATCVLIDLQEVDLKIDEMIKKLKIMDRAYGNREALIKREKQLELVESKVHSDRTNHLDAELIVDATRTKIKEVETKLYGGNVRDHRELQDLDKELNFLKRDLETRELQALELLDVLDNSQELFSKVKKILETDSVNWTVLQERLAMEKERLTTQLSKLKNHRDSVAKDIARPALSLYERLRIPKAGRPVSKLDRGMCTTCHVSIPTQLERKIKQGRQDLTCNNCGRILSE
jgi:predicted  nucleic acid-binding Zn-ribbon protein